MDDFDEKIAEMAEAYTLKRFEQTGNAGFTVAPYVNSDELSSAFEMGAQAARELLRYVENFDVLNSLKEVAKANEEMQRLTKENEALREANKNFHENLTGDIEKLTAQNAMMREALEKIAIDDDVNKNFNRSEDENQYYINLAREVLSAIGEVGEK